MPIRGLVLGLAAMLALAPAGPARAVLLTLDPAAQTVDLGDTVSLDLNVSGLGDSAAPSLGAWDVDIAFDPAILGFAGASIGPFLGDPTLGEAIAGVDASMPGIVDIFELSLLEGDGLTCLFCIPPFLDDLQAGAFTLATLTFDTLAVGTSALSIAIDDLGDTDGLPLGASVESASVTVEASIPVPEPGTHLLLLFGLAGIAALRRFDLQG